MPLPATYMKATLHFLNVDTQSRANCVLWYNSGSGATPPTLATIVATANSFMTAYSTATAGWLPASCWLASVTLKYVSGGNEIEGDSTMSHIEGTVAGEVLPEEDVLCIQRRTGKRGRNKRGRVFFPYVAEENQADGQLTGLGIGKAGAMATMVKSNVIHAGGTWTPATPDWKSSILEPVVQVGYVEQVCSRRDRRSPKVLSSVRF